MTYKQEDEINLTHILISLWSSRALISISVILAVTIGSLYLSFQDKVYESRLVFSLQYTPPKQNEANLFTYFEKSFFSKKNFNKWRSKNSKYNLTYQDISFIDEIDGFEVSIDEDKRSVVFKHERNKSSYLLIRSNQLNLLNGVHGYSNYINDILHREYVDAAIKVSESMSTDSINVLDQDVVTDYKQYIEFSKKNSLFYIRPPSKPQKVSPNNSLTLLLFFITGFVLSSFYVLLKNAITGRVESRENIDR